MIDMMLRANGFKRGKDDVWTREVFSLNTMRTYTMRYWEHDDKATVVVIGPDDRSIGEQTDEPAEVASTAIALAHRLAG